MDKVYDITETFLSVSDGIHRDKRKYQLFRNNLPVILSSVFDTLPYSRESL